MTQPVRTLTQRSVVSRRIFRVVAYLAIVAGLLSLFGVRPMNNRTIEVVLGTAALVTGFGLIFLLSRRRISAH